MAPELLLYEHTRRILGTKQVSCAGDVLCGRVRLLHHAFAYRLEGSRCRF